MNMLEASAYYEANILGNPRLPDGVSFLIGNFHTLFGTDAGREMQLLADHYSWPLVWGFAANPPHFGLQNERESSPNAMNTSFPGNQRILDPEVLASQALNYTMGAGAKDVFLEVW